MPEIVPEEAEIVRRIYRLFASGKTIRSIANTLTKEGIPTPRGKAKWQNTTVESILTNEKYKGSAILQKKFTVDFLSKKVKLNEGELPQYYVENSHPAIIDGREWDMVQTEMKRRKSMGHKPNSLKPFSSMIICGDCGGVYGSKVWHSTDKYRRIIWRCNSKYEGEERCRTPHLYETDVIRLFLRALSELLTDREALLEDCQLMHDTLADTSGIDNQCDMISEEMDIIALRTEQLMKENATVAMDQEEYNRKYDGYAARFEDAKQKMTELQALRTARIFEADAIECFMGTLLRDPELPLEFSPELWNSLVDHVTVYRDERLVFTFRNGQEITEIL